MTTSTRLEPWTRRHAGWVPVAVKEFTDHLYSVRFASLVVILGLIAVATVYSAGQALREVASQAAGSPGLFLRLFTVQADPIPLSFLSFFAFVAPIVGIAYGFDAVNGERAQGTLPRLVSQPIYRDDVINGKFVAGLGIVGLTLAVITAIVGGLGIIVLGITPTWGEVTRISIWVIAGVIYIGVWLAFGILCSVLVRRTATSAMLGIAAWLVLALFGALLAQVAADVIAPVDPANPESPLANVEMELTLARLSPITLFDEASTALLSPEVRSLGFITLEQADRAVVSQLSVTQSLLLVWAQLVGLVAMTVVLFAWAYVVFMRQEVRA